MSTSELLKNKKDVLISLARKKSKLSDSTLKAMTKDKLVRVIKGLPLTSSPKVAVRPSPTKARIAVCKERLVKCQDKVAAEKVSKVKVSEVKKVSNVKKVSEVKKVSNVKKVTTKSTKVRRSPLPSFRSPKPKLRSPSTIGCMQRSKMPLQDHQKRVVSFMKDHRGVVVAHDVGSGKTLTAVAVSQCFLDDNPKGVVVVVTPVSLQDNFKKEMKGYGLSEDDDRYVFFTMQKFTNTFKKREFLSNAMLIIDEAHHLRTQADASKKKKKAKKAKKVESDEESEDEESDDSDDEQSEVESSKRSDVALKCAKKAKKVLLLTATSIYNNPYDLVNLVSMVRGIDPIGKSAFEKLLNEPDAFRKFFSCVFSFYTVSKTNKDYPTVKEEYVEIPMTMEYYRKYKTIELDGVTAWRFLSGVRRAANVLGDSPKTDWIMKELEKGQKTVIYSSFLESGVKYIQKRLDKEKIPYLEITGKTKKPDRMKMVRDYNSNKVNVLFITKAGGEGLDLKETRRVIIVESSWNRPAEEQVIGRAARYKSHTDLPENERNVLVSHLLLVKPESIMKDPAFKKRGERPSADSMLKAMVEDKLERNIQIIKKISPMSIENAKC